MNRMSKERLVAFTDALLAIIMTILVLELEHPAEPTPAAFWALRTNYFAYALSFFWLGSLWVGLNDVWEKAKYVNRAVIWWNLGLLFLASLIPYATSLCSDYFHSATMQGFYGIVVIAMTTVNWFLHGSLAKANSDIPELVTAARAYQRLLLPDIIIKCGGLIISITLWPLTMMYSVLVAAVYILIMKRVIDGKTAKNKAAVEEKKD